MNVLYYNNKRIISKVKLLVKSGKVKEDFKIKSFFNVPEYLFLLKKSNLTLNNLLDEVDKCSSKYYKNSLVKVFVLFLEDNEVVFLEGGLHLSRSLNCLIVSQNYKDFKLNLKSLGIMLFIYIKFYQLDLTNKRKFLEVLNILKGNLKCFNQKIFFFNVIS